MLKTGRFGFCSTHKNRSVIQCLCIYFKDECKFHIILIRSISNGYLKISYNVHCFSSIWAPYVRFYNYKNFKIKSWEISLFYPKIHLNITRRVCFWYHINLHPVRHECICSLETLSSSWSRLSVSWLGITRKKASPFQLIFSWSFEVNLICWQFRLKYVSTKIKHTSIINTIKLKNQVEPNCLLHSIVS